MYTYSGPTGLHIDGSSRESVDGRRFPVENPATGSPIVNIADATLADGRAAAAAASSAFEEWSKRPSRERGEVLRACFETLVAHSAELADLIVAENGKARMDALAEVEYAAEFFRWYSEEAVRLPGDLRSSPSGQRRIMEVSQPVGVVLAVTPWNLPAAMITRKIAPALAAGCTVVVKPSNQTPLTALRLVELLEEVGLPSGAVNVIPTTRDREVVADLLDYGPVRMLSFTGSTAVGSTLLGQASRRVLNTAMELGGNAPFIVFDDADMDLAVSSAIVAKMRHNAEACTAANRFYVHDAVRDEFTARFAAAMDGLQLGPGSDIGTEVGPMASRAGLEKLEAEVERAIAAGARRATSTAVPNGPGYYFPPTVLTDVAPDAEILNTELFGPVAPVVGFRREDEVVAMANSTELGLGSYVFSADLARALRVAEAVDAGMVGVNTGIFSDPAAPFGGTRQSGIGREGGNDGIQEFLETKYIAVQW